MREKNYNIIKIDSTKNIYFQYYHLSINYYDFNYYINRNYCGFYDISLILIG